MSWFFLVVALFCALPLVYFYVCNKNRTVEKHYYQNHSLSFALLEGSYFILIVSMVYNLRTVVEDIFGYYSKKFL